MSVQVKGSGTIGGLDEGLVVSGIVTASTQINIGSNIKIGNAGVVTATTFSGSGASLTNLPAANLTGTLPAISGANLTSLPSQVTINNASGNRVVTSDGGTTLNGEDTLRYDGTNFLIGTNTEAPYSNRNLTVAAGGSGSGTVAIEIRSASTGTGRVIFSDGTSADSSANEGQLIYQQSDHKMLFGVAANYQNMALESTGGTGADLNLIDGNLKFASGHGIDFSATANAGGADAVATTSSELFDDYEEGSWTPVIAASAANPSFTFASGFPRGRYRKIGEQVTLWYDIAWSGLPSQGGGTLQMQNFPYSTGSSLYHGGGLMSHTVGTNAGGAYTGKHTHYANPNSSFMYILSGASTNGHMQCTALNSSGHIFGFFTFAT